MKSRYLSFVACNRLIVPRHQATAGGQAHYPLK
jgi:hypothetical protein